MSLDIRVHTSLGDISRTEWSRIWLAAPGVSFFQSYPWVAAWWVTFNHLGQLRLVSVWDGPELVGIAPLYRRRIPGGRDEIRLVGEEHADYPGFLVVGGRWDVLDALGRACFHLIEDGAAVVRLSDIRDDSDFGVELAARRWTRRLLTWPSKSTRCPRLSLSAESLSQSQSKASTRRHRRALARRGRVTVEHIREPEVILELLPTLFDLHVSRWSSTPFPSLFVKQDNRRFYELLVADPKANEHLVMTVLRIDARPVALHFGFVSESDLVWYKPAFDVRYADCSPGEIMLVEMIRYASETGLKGVDFTRGEEPFKYRFANDVRYVTSYQFGRRDSRNLYSWLDSWSRAGLRRLRATYRRERPSNTISG